MAPVEARAVRRDRRHIHDAAPALGPHAVDHALVQHKRRRQVRAQRVLELGDADVPDVGHALAVARVGDQDVDAAAVLAAHFVAEPGAFGGRAQVGVVRGDA